MVGSVEKGWLDLSEKDTGPQQEALAVFAMKATENKIKPRTEVQKDSNNSYRIETTSVPTSPQCNMPHSSLPWKLFPPFIIMVTVDVLH